MFAKNGNVKYGFKLILHWQKNVIFRKWFYFLKVNLLSFIFVWILLIFINLNIVFLGGNSYYPIKLKIFLYIITYNTVIFNQNPQNFIISKTIVYSLFKNMICRILICLTAQKFASKVVTPVWKKQRFNAFFQYTWCEHRRFADFLLEKTYIIVLNDDTCTN